MCKSSLLCSCLQVNFCLALLMLICFVIGLLCLLALLFVLVVCVYCATDCRCFIICLIHVISFVGCLKRDTLGYG